MTINNDLLLAILSMDAYNQGYFPGVSHGETQIGSATAKPLDAVGVGPELYNEWQAAGFYAVAYDTPDGTVISFRGTDDYDSLSGSNDVITGWTTGLGFESEQAILAAQFYKAVAASKIDGVSADTITYEQLKSANITLTGHSLGGGLAGLVAQGSGIFANPGA